MTRIPISSDPLLPVRTRIVATLGPASSDPARIRELIAAGAGVFRLNFSHGSQDEHAQTLASIREASGDLGQVVAVIGDLCGPKIRLNHVSADITLRVGQMVRFVRGEGACTSDALTVNYSRFIDEIGVGHRIYIDDGMVRMLVAERDDQGCTCHCTVGGAISSHKGVNLPDTRLTLSALTDKDRVDLRWAIDNQLDYVALSFARQPADLDLLQELVRDSARRPGLIVKIEKAEALTHLDHFIEQSDGVMIARGDMGVELDIWQVPLIQKLITSKCRQAGKPVIVATQMLQSMVSSPMPTRAEVSDVANAILDEADAVMLSAESAVGQFPVEAVHMMARVARVTESYQSLSQYAAQDDVAPAASERMAAATVLGAVRTARQVGARAMAVWTHTGATARLVAQQRPRMPIIALTRDDAACRRMALLQGVIPVRVGPALSPVHLSQMLDEILIVRNLAREPDLIVVVGSTRPLVTGATDLIIVHRVSTPTP